MANINKSFNFRNGVQVDNDNFVVNPNGLVGIGTSIPKESLDVYGIVKVTGLVTTTNLSVTGFSTFTEVRLGNGIKMSSNSGIITATSFYGNGATLSNLPTSQWVDIDVGLGFTSIYAVGNVGIETTDPRFTFQVGNNPNSGNSGIGFNSTGDIKASGIITAGYFNGNGSSLTTLNASNISSGTLNNQRLPSNISVSGIITATTKFDGPLTGSVTGNVTGNVTGIASTALSLSGTPNITVGFVTATQFIGNVTGTASTALSLSGTPNITVGFVTATNIVSGFSSVGVSTVSTRLRVSGKIGVSTDSPQADIHIVNASDASLHLTGNQSTITLGRSSSPTGGNSSGLKFGNTSGLYSYSTQKTLDIFNYDTGNINSYLHYGSTAGVGTGSFNWIYGQYPLDPLMSLTYQGNLGIGITNPTKELEVDGTIETTYLNVVEDFTAIGSGTSTSVRKLYVYDGVTALLDSAGNRLIPEESVNVNITSGISTFFKTKVTNVAIFENKIGIGNTKPLESLHIGGNYIVDPKDALVIASSGIGIGTTSIRFGLGIDSEKSGAIFESVGIGTTNTFVSELGIDFRLYVNGDGFFDKELYATSVIGESISSAGIVSATNGFTSGTGTAVKIKTIGNKLFFTVVGVGSTSLTLY